MNRLASPPPSALVGDHGAWRTARAERVAWRLPAAGLVSVLVLSEVCARIWEIPGHLTARDVLFGVLPREIEELSARIGLNASNEAVENFWLSIFRQLGMVGSVPVVVALGCAMRWIWSVSPMQMRLSMVVFFLSASTTRSPASKTICLTRLFVAVAATRERVGALRDAPAWAAMTWPVVRRVR